MENQLRLWRILKWSQMMQWIGAGMEIMLRKIQVGMMNCWIIFCVNIDVFSIHHMICTGMLFSLAILTFPEFILTFTIYVSITQIPSFETAAKGTGMFQILFH
jgi:hypothetical protein